MANYNYTITFKSLRAGTTYVVNIGGGTGTAVPLMGGAQPFITQEDDDENMFCPIRTQSGYLRIIDNGKDANGNAFDWKDMIPATDTSRPVTLTHTDNGSTVVDWVGFMQAQDFGSVLYGNPQEREFPIQCVLTVTQGTDINYQQTAIQNFAYLLKQIVDAIPSAQRPTAFYIQGGADAQQWMLKKIDWQNFVSEDGDGKITARFNCFDCLQDMCAFWGWTARTYGSTIFLTCADDSAETNWLYLTYSDLVQLAAYVSGPIPGTVTDTFVFSNLDNLGDIFASTNNDEYVQRGHNKAVVTANSNNAANKVIDYAPESVALYMQRQTPTIETIDGQKVYYFGDLNQFPLPDAPSPFLRGEALSGNGSFSYISTDNSLSRADDTQISDSAIRIKKTYNGSVFASLETVYQHSFRFNGDIYWFFSTGGIRLHGTIWQRRYKVEDYDSTTKRGHKTMYMCLGIGATRATAKWWNGGGWQDSITTFKATIGNGDDLLWTTGIPGSSAYAIYRNFIPTDEIDLTGLIFVDFKGSDDLDEVNGEKSFFITGFYVEFTRNNYTINYHQEQRPTSFEYTSNNANNIRNEWNADLPYASDNNMEFSYGVLLNLDGTPLETITYGNQQLHPEQHLANRVTEYWQISKRRIYSELRSNVIPNITPRHKVMLDGTTAYPIAISRDWCDDITQITVLEL